MERQSRIQQFKAGKVWHFKSHPNSLIYFGLDSGQYESANHFNKVPSGVNTKFDGGTYPG